MALVIDDDLAATELLITQLLQEELTIDRGAQYLEELQLMEAIRASLLDEREKVTDRSTDSAKNNDVQGQTPTAPSDFLQVKPPDSVVTFRLTNQGQVSQVDASLAVSPQSKDLDAHTSRQVALELATEECQLNVDNAFVTVLDCVDDNIDQDAEIVSGSETIEELVVTDPGEKGKGKAPVEEEKQEPTATKEKQKEQEAEHASTTTREGQDPDKKLDLKLLRVESLFPALPTCGVCGDQFRQTNNPLAASKTPTSSGKLPFGLYLECPGKHSYCLDCLTGYFRAKLDDGYMSGNESRIVFPIRCPECPPQVYAIDDSIAEKILEGDLLQSWHFQKLLDEIPRQYCPNQACSSLLEFEENPDVPQAECPACHVLICMPCRCIWHGDFTCEQYQSIPLDERESDDRLLMRMANTHKWRRCRKCRFFVELVSGCNHMTCVCKHEFCHQCGADWKGACSRNPPCRFWDEEMLLDNRSSDATYPTSVPLPSGSLSIPSQPVNGLLPI